MSTKLYSRPGVSQTTRTGSSGVSEEVKDVSWIDNYTRQLAYQMAERNKLSIPSAWKEKMLGQEKKKKRRLFPVNRLTLSFVADPNFFSPLLENKNTTTTNHIPRNMYQYKVICSL